MASLDEADSRPLIAAENPQNGSPLHDDCEAQEAALTRPTPFLWLLTFTSGVSGLLFGYDTGVISSTLVSIGSDLSSRSLTTLDKSLITSSTSFFALLASPVSGALGDRLGRKNVILLASVLFILGAALQAFSTTVFLMIVGRSIVGIAVGSASFIVPLYISELAPAPFRGRLVTVDELLITGGQVVAYIIGWLFSSVPGGWRWMVGIGALPAIVQLALMGSMPETPRWLVKVDRIAQARKVLTKVYGNSSPDQQRLIEAVLRRIEASVTEESATATVSAWSGLFNVPVNRRALTIACVLQGAQQLVGFNSLMYFAATIFALVGFKEPTLPSLTIAGTNFAVTLVAFVLIDRLGRRKMLLWSIPGMVIGLLACSLAFSHLEISAFSKRSPSDTWSTVLLVATTFYVACYAIGLGVVPWQQSELFGLGVRAVGSGLATATNWGANTVVGLTFLPLLQLLSPSGAFLLYACVCVASWLAIYRIYPETAGLGLEEVTSLLSHSYGVEESVRMWKQRSK